MQKRQLSIEQALYILAFLLAFGLRFIQLGTAPLSEVEAQAALQAYHLAEGELVEAVQQPAYTLFTSFLFSMFGSSEFIARLLPALAGSALVLIPLSLRKQIGSPIALLLTIGLAIDPMLVGLSRLAGSAIMAYTFGLAAGISLYKRKHVFAGILVGVTLLSGETAIAGIIILLFAFALSQTQLMFRERRDRSKKSSPWILFSNKQFLISLFVTLLITGTLFLRVPSGLSAVGRTIPSYLNGWSSPSNIPIVQFIFSLIAYQPIALLFGVIAVIRNFVGDENKLVKYLGIWLLAGLILTLSYPARQISDLVWVITPLLALAAIEISAHLDWESTDKSALYGQLGLTLLLMTFLFMFSARTAKSAVYIVPDGGFQIYGIQLQLTQQVITSFSIVGLAVVSTLLIAAGWSKKAAVKGLVAGVSIFVSIFLLSYSWNNLTSYKRTINELWYPGPGVSNVTLFSDTIEEFSHFYTGDRTSLEIVYHPELASLHWELRHMTNARNQGLLSPQDSPEAVITSEFSQSPQLSSQYRGQSIAWNTTPVLVDGLPTEILRWLIFRNNDTTSENLILWLRSDIFPEDISPPTGIFIGPDESIP